MRLGVSCRVLKNIKKLSKVYDKPIPIVRYKLDSRIRIHDIVTLRSNSSSIKVRIESISEYTMDDDNIPYDELRVVYGDKLKEILNKQHVSKIYVVYVKAICF